MNIHKIKFSGKILERGFWLYLWQVKSKNKVAWYIGRTGDSSSPNAASPFSRLSQHLDLRENSKSNTLVKNLRIQGFNPSECEFHLCSIGPLFPEQNTFEEHKPFRDIVGLLEAELAYYVRSTGNVVIGTHPKRGNYDNNLFSEIKEIVAKFINS